MGIFSLFGKKHGDPAAKPAADTPARAQPDELVRDSEPPSGSMRENAASERRQAAQATALKIDAIESEMSSEFVRPNAQTEKPSSAQPPAPPDMLLSADTILATPAIQAILEDVPLFEEAAILFANGQTEIVEHLLKDAIDADTLGPASITAWAMLFDLHQISGNQAEFEHLSILYASRFESSPPAWMSLALPESGTEPLARAPAVPSVVFNGKLDAGIVKSLEKVRSLAEKHSVIRLEFGRVAEVDPIGCGLLVRVLVQLKKTGIDLVLVGAPELVKKIKAILVVGRRDETEAPWLLLLELLAMMNLEPAFEEASIDYCVTFEVSPPAFVAPKNKITALMEEPHLPALDANVDIFVMPALIEGRADSLVSTLGDFVSRHNPARVDCTALMRVDVNAAGQLQAGLLPLSGDGRRIEFFNVNHLVAALLNVVGLKNLVHISTRKI